MVFRGRQLSGDQIPLHLNVAIMPVDVVPLQRQQLAEP
jgi:hypothetical protein